MNRYLVHWSSDNGEVDYDSPRVVEAESAVAAAEQVLYPGLEILEVDLLIPQTGGDWDRFERVPGGWKLKEGM